MWKPETNAVQTGLKDGRFANGEYSLLAAGPPRLANIGPAAALASSLVGEAQGLGQIVHPLGTVQQIGLSQSTQFSRIFEIGSRRSYFIPGRSVGQLQLGKVWYHGATLLRLLYAYFEDTLGPVSVAPMLPAAAAAAMANPHNVIVPPGFENVFLNMGSDLFSQMMGLLWYIKDNNKDVLGAIYLEGCTVPNHSIQTDSQGLVFSESVGVQFERIVPVEISAVPLISINNTSAGMANTDYPGQEAALDHGNDRDTRHRGGQGHLAARPGRHDRSPGILGVAGRQALRSVPLRPVWLGYEGRRCPHQRQDDLGVLRAGHRRPDPRPRDRHPHPAPGRNVPGGRPVRKHHTQLVSRPHRCCGGAWYPLRMTVLTESFAESLVKEAQEGRGLDALARFAAAALVMRMLDSGRDRLEAVKAQAQAKHLLDRSQAVSLQREVGRPGSPRLFVQAETPDGTEDVGDRYHSGFLPNVPLGMDQGMVRLAEEGKTAAAKWVKEFRAGNLDEGDVRKMLVGKYRMSDVGERLFANLRGKELEVPAHVVPDNPRLLDPTLPSSEVAKFLPPNLGRVLGADGPNEIQLTPDQRAALRHPNAPVFAPRVDQQQKKLPGYHTLFPEEIEQNPSYMLEGMVNPGLGEEIRKAKNADLVHERERLRTLANDYSFLPNKKDQIKARTLHEKAQRLGDEVTGRGISGHLARHPEGIVTPEPMDTYASAVRAAPLREVADGLGDLRKQLSDLRAMAEGPSPADVAKPLLAGDAVTAATLAAGSLYAKHKRDTEAAQKKEAMGPLVPPAPSRLYAPKSLAQNLRGPAGFKPVSPILPPKTTPAPSAPPSKTHPLLTAQGVATLGVLGAAGYGLTKATDKAVGYMNEEAPPTDWAMRRYGALSPAQTTNVYGQPNY